MNASKDNMSRLKKLTIFAQVGRVVSDCSSCQIGGTDVAISSLSPRLPLLLPSCISLTFYPVFIKYFHWITSSNIFIEYFISITAVSSVLYICLNFNQINSLFVQMFYLIRWNFEYWTSSWIQNYRPFLCQKKPQLSQSAKERKHCQRHNGPEGWVHITEYRLSINFQISTKHQHLNLI